MSTRPTVAVLGGGVAGLSAAHLLAPHYDVTVFESRGSSAADLGGKARSYGSDSHQPPRFGEHGFRFFPGFYQHVTAMMADIPIGGGHSVADRLSSTTACGFYAMLPEEEDTRKRATVIASHVCRLGALLTVIYWLVAAFLWYRHAGVGAWIAWLAAPVVWIVVRTVVIGLTAGPDSFVLLNLPGPNRAGHRWLQINLLRLHHWGRVVVAAALVVGLLTWGGTITRSAPLVLLVIALVWWYPAVAALDYLWVRVLGKIPIGVRPGLLESASATLRIVAIVASSKRRMFTQWEQESWWSYIAAYRYSRPFRLAFATGLTRGFVATRAEEMSARTGATILAQLLYDITPAFRSRTDAADRILSSPTQQAWIEPWVRKLTSDGVRFNTVDPAAPAGSHPSRVEVTRLVLGEPSGDGQPTVGAFRFVDPSRPDLGEREVGGFDHYVLAVSGTAAQRVFANSGEIIGADRAVARDVRPTDRLGDGPGGEIPFLHGIFSLNFGWMTGIVFHLDEDVDLPSGHLLCLESEWALTAIEQRGFWPDTTTTWKRIISVNVSDWFSPSGSALPARFETLDTIATEVWRQLRGHVPQLSHITVTPPYVADTAIIDPDVPTAAEAAGRMPLLVGRTPESAVLENLALVNEEKLLINTPGSWANRPTARTVFANLVIAGDYVRTHTDFASMEAANEAARWAARVLLERDGRKVPDEPADLPIPAELAVPLRAMRAVDRVAMRLGFPHPLMLLATPLGWLARGEEVLHRLILRRRRRQDSPPRPRR